MCSFIKCFDQSLEIDLSFSVVRKLLSRFEHSHQALGFSRKSGTGLCTDQTSGIVWPLVMMGSRKEGPTSGMGQCLARHKRQGTGEWSDIDHQDVLMCPQHCIEVGHRWLEQQSWVTRGGSQTTHRLSVREKPRSRESMRVVWMTRSGITQVKSHWERYDLRGSHPRGELHAWHVNGEGWCDSNSIEEKDSWSS